MERLDRLLNEKPDLIKAKDSHGWGVLHEAVRGQNIDVVKLLVTRGADVNALTNDGHSALHFAMRHSKNKNHNNPISFFLQSYGAEEKVAERNTEPEL